MPSSTKNQITIALIGLIGVLLTAVISNVDKLSIVFSGKSTLVTGYSGYKPSGDFATEFKYLFNITGLETTLDSMEQQWISSSRMQDLTQHPEDKDQINAIYDAVSKEMPTVGEIEERFLPIYQKYYTVKEIQELNKFFSTETMQDYVKKAPLVMQDATPIMLQMQSEIANRIAARLRNNQ